MVSHLQLARDADGSASARLGTALNARNAALVVGRTGLKVTWCGTRLRRLRSLFLGSIAKKTVKARAKIQTGQRGLALAASLTGSTSLSAMHLICSLTDATLSTASEHLGSHTLYLCGMGALSSGRTRLPASRLRRRLAGTHKTFEEISRYAAFLLMRSFSSPVSALISNCVSKVVAYEAHFSATLALGLLLLLIGTYCIVEHITALDNR